MAAAGLVEQLPCPDDRRGQIVRATDAGRRLRREIWPVHAGAAIRRTVGDRLTEGEAEALAGLLGRIAVPGAG